MSTTYYLTLPREEPPADVLAALRIVRAWQVAVRTRESEAPRLSQAAQSSAQSGPLMHQNDWRDVLLGLPGSVP